MFKRKSEEEGAQPPRDRIETANRRGRLLELERSVPACANLLRSVESQIANAQLEVQRLITLHAQLGQDCLALAAEETHLQAREANPFLSD